MLFTTIMLWMHGCRSNSLILTWHCDSMLKANTIQCHSKYKLSTHDVPVVCQRTEVGESHLQRKTAAGVVGDRSAGLSGLAFCISKGDQALLFAVCAVAVLGCDSGEPAALHCIASHCRRCIDCTVMLLILHRYSSKGMASQFCQCIDAAQADTNTCLLKSLGSLVELQGLCLTYQQEGC